MKKTKPSHSAHAPLIIDVEGPVLTKADRRRLKHPLVGGVVHFGRHWQSRDQLLKLNAEIKAIRPDILICVDHEGGRVQRFKTDGFTHLPPMRVLGQLFGQDKVPGDGSGALRAMQAANAAGYVLAAELRACGVDLSFTPVLDLDWGASGVIGDRAFNRDPRVVTVLAQNLMHGLLRAGMAHCGKHFPGHGFIRADSHAAVATDTRSLKAILADDASPYRWLANNLTAVMPAHVIFPKVDARPTGFSPRWLQDILREQLGFSGAIISDDLSMTAARELDGVPLSYAESVMAATEAGCDLALVCNQSLDGGLVLDNMLETLDSAMATGCWRVDETADARRRVLLPQTEPLSWDVLVRDARYIQALEQLP
jgi:beta-N-acetylhexosaminidase